MYKIWNELLILLFPQSVNIGVLRKYFLFYIFKTHSQYKIIQCFSPYSPPAAKYMFICTSPKTYNRDFNTHEMTFTYPNLARGP